VPLDSVFQDRLQYQARPEKSLESVSGEPTKYRHARQQKSLSCNQEKRAFLWRYRQEAQSKISGTARDSSAFLSRSSITRCRMCRSSKRRLCEISPSCHTCLSSPRRYAPQASTWLNVSVNAARALSDETILVVV